MRPVIINLLTVLIIFFVSCEQEYTPKPREYFRIDLPEKKYQVFDKNYPYKFENPVYSKIIDSKKDSFWVNIVFPGFNAAIYLTYKKINNNLPAYLEETRKFAYKHTVKADAINEYLLVHPEHNVYGILYEIKGNAASSVNFYATDSSSNFLRGALYFNVAPNKDSLAPVIEFITDDIAHLIETLEWKNQKK